MVGMQGHPHTGQTPHRSQLAALAHGLVVGGQFFSERKIQLQQVRRLHRDSAFGRHDLLQFFECAVQSGLGCEASERALELDL